MSVDFKVDYDLPTHPNMHKSMVRDGFKVSSRLEEYQAKFRRRREREMSHAKAPRRQGMSSAGSHAKAQGRKGVGL